MGEKMVKVRVPGTSANCGPGFDCLGVACTIYNEFELTLLETPGVKIQATGESAEKIPCNEKNVVWQAIQLLLRRAKLETKYQGAVIRMHNGVPLSRGLGSSATAIVGGLKAANTFLDNLFSDAELLDMATEMEGHPDNVAPAIYGGFTVSVVQAGKPQCLHFLPELAMKLVVVIPDFYLATKEARAVLPKEIKLQDAVYNIGRAAMLTAALCKGDAEFLSNVFDDALHQPYRAKLIPGMYEVFQAAKAAGAYGASMSGAGPCLIAFTPAERAEAVGQAMVTEFANHAVKGQAVLLDIDTQGAIEI